MAQSRPPMRLMYSNRYHVLPVDTSRALIPEELVDMMLSRRGPYFVEVEGKKIRVTPGTAMNLACEIFAAYHAPSALDDDGFQSHTERFEQSMTQRLLTDPSSSDSESVSSSDDLVYDNQCYR